MNLNKILIFDIETQADPWDKIKHLCKSGKKFEEPPPFEAKPWVEPEMPDYSAKLKTEAAITKRIADWPNKVEEQRVRHEEKEQARQATWEKNRQQKLDKHNESVVKERDKWRKSIATNPCASSMVGLSLMYDWRFNCLEVDEEKTEGRILMKLVKVINEAQLVITWNGHKFDLPYVRRRCILNGIRPPSYRRGRWMQDRFIDAQEEWDDYAHYGNRLSDSNMDFVCQTLGLPTKPGNPLDWGKWTSRQRREYMSHDIKRTFDICERMSLIEGFDNNPGGYDLDDVSEFIPPVVKPQPKEDGIPGL